VTPPHPGTFDHPALVRLGREILVAIGEDPDRPDLLDTPRRWADAWREFMHYDERKVDTRFQTMTSGQLVTVGPIRVWSMCEHHILPFVCDLWVGVVPRGELLGLSKYARIAMRFAHRLQVQERLTSQIAFMITQAGNSPDVAVLSRGDHLCVTMRGVGIPAPMTTLDTRGRFRTEPALRAEFLTLCGR
jgi:GTP cyclohydrolase IA